MKYNFPTKIIIENNALENNKNIFTEYGKKCLIITSKTSAKVSGVLDDLIKILKNVNVDYQVYDSIMQNPSVESCLESGLLANKIKADYIIGIGGGSPLDASKTASIVATNPELDEKQLYATQWANKPLPLILIGTTAGTGSEVTNVSVMTNSLGNKKSIHNEDLYAKYAIGDIKYLKSMSDNIRKSTAIDAFSHLLESYLNNTSTPISKAYSYQGLKILYPNLKILANNQKLNDKQIEEVYIASIFGGLAINITGTSFCHSLGYYFTEKYNIPHGFACALFENSLIDYELENNKEYITDLFNSLHIDINELKNIIDKIIPTFNIELKPDQLEIIINRFAGNKNIINTYGTISMDDIKNILINRFNINTVTM